MVEAIRTFSLLPAIWAWTFEVLVEWLKALGTLGLPIAIVFVALIFRRPIAVWLESANRVSIGPIELNRDIERIAKASDKILEDTTRLQILLGEARILEAEVFLSYPLLSETQAEQMRENTKKIQDEIERLRSAQI